MSRKKSTYHTACSFTALQTVNGAAGDTNGALATTAAPSTRKLLWEFAIGGYKGRFYSSTSFNGAFEVTINARWDGSQWVRDSSSLFAVKWTFHNYEFRIDVKTGSGSFADNAWTGFFDLAFPFGAPKPHAGRERAARRHGHLQFVHRRAGPAVRHSRRSLAMGGRSGRDIFWKNVVEQVGAGRGHAAANAARAETSAVTANATRRS